MRSDRIAIQDKQNEIATLAGQEGLPIPSFDAAVAELPSSADDLEMAITETIKVTEREIASIDSKLDLITDLTAQLQVQQEALDILLARKRVLIERGQRHQGKKIEEQVERAREQQLTLRSALQSLQDSLRQRVKQLDVSFGQTAINNAETTVRKQLEALHIVLGNRIELQSRHDNYLVVLKDRQDSLADHYNRLAKYSASLGSWIVPPNPFAETLVALRQRCQQEIIDANEKGILQELEKIQQQENASQAKIELCRQEIEDAHERITIMLVQRYRPPTKGYNFTDIVSVWPLVSEYTTLDRNRLEEERAAAEKELEELEHQELALSTQLQTGGTRLDLEQARARMEQQERSYQTKKRGSQLLKAVSERLMRKMLPRTEYYMQQILPLLTSGRYHDIRLRTEEEEGTTSGGPFQLGVWETAAGEYVPKSALSGGAADQLSLALRLAFAIAALPRELGAAPGFVFLDEPLSSFDRVVESNLPVVAAAPTPPLPAASGDEEMIEEEKQPAEAEPDSVAVEM